MYYRQGDRARTEDISSDGFISVSVDGDVAEFLISGLPPYTNYTIHVQAMTSEDGEIDVEIVQRTQSTTDTPPTVPPTTMPIDSPTSRTITYLIADPLQIDTGKVM